MSDRERIDLIIRSIQEDDMLTLILKRVRRRISNIEQTEAR